MDVIEIAFLGQTLFELFESDLKLPDAFGLYIFQDDLVNTSGFIYADSTQGGYGHAVFKIELKVLILTAKHNGVDLGLGIFEGEIEMTGNRRSKVGDFARDPNKVELFFKGRFNPCGQFGDRVNMAWYRHVGQYEYYLCL